VRKQQQEEAEIAARASRKELQTAVLKEQQKEERRVEREALKEREDAVSYPRRLAVTGYEVRTSRVPLELS
jgi:hypothetical protein